MGIVPELWEAHGENGAGGRAFSLTLEGPRGHHSPGLPGLGWLLREQVWIQAARGHVPARPSLALGP